MRSLEILFLGLLMLFWMIYKAVIYIMLRHFYAYNIEADGILFRNFLSYLVASHKIIMSLPREILKMDYLIASEEYKTKL